MGEGRAFRRERPKEVIPGSTILLNIYDVVEHPFNYQVAKLLTLGIHHTGIQIGMREFAFTLEGIVVTEPHRIPRCKLTHRLLVTSEATDEVITSALRKLQRTFTPQTYDPLEKNCNHFTDAFCQLFDVRVPAWVNRAPTMASMLGTRFRLRPARVTAPALAWSLLLEDDGQPPPRPTRATSTESLEDEEEDDTTADDDDDDDPSRANENERGDDDDKIRGKKHAAAGATKAAALKSKPTTTTRRKPGPRRTLRLNERGELQVHPKLTKVKDHGVPTKKNQNANNNANNALPPPTTWATLLSEIHSADADQGAVVTPAGLGRLLASDANLVDSSRITALE